MSKTEKPLNRGDVIDVTGISKVEYQALMTLMSLNGLPPRDNLTAQYPPKFAGVFGYPHEERAVDGFTECSFLQVCGKDGDRLSAHPATDSMLIPKGDTYTAKEAALILARQST